MKSILITLLFTLTSLFIFSQEVQQEDTSLNGQFDKIYRTSTTYKIYKVVSKDKYQRLKLNVLDSLKVAKEILIQKESLLKTERENTKKIQNALSKIQLELDSSSKNENSISLFGKQVSKTTYNLTLWSVIALLLISLLYFISKFIKSNVLTKGAQHNLEVVEQEFEQHRKKSLEREQKLRRQLQDEINKQRNS